MKIAVVGTGYVGLVSGTCFAEMGNNVTCVDINEKKVEQLRNGKVPIYEPQLEMLFERNIRQDRLFFTTSLEDAIKEITNKELGFTSIVNNEDKLVGILTDGDLRRAILNKKNINSSIEDCMTKTPITLNGSEMAIEAVNIMEKFKVNCFLITDKDEKVIGTLNLNDLFDSKVI